ncbi:MAG: hypothetical protein GY733_24260 [bacterium]|nr:hypothetical protein [bacterium]
MTDEELDQELSALLDDELSAERARQLREEVAADPRLRARLAAFESVDRSLSELVRPQLPVDMRARLQERIDRHEGVPARGSERASASRVRWGAPLAAALAAGLVVALLTRTVSVSDDAPPPALQAQAGPEQPVLAQRSDATPGPTPAPPMPPMPAVEVAAVDIEPALDPEPLEPARNDAGFAIEDASDEELAIAFELETLRDLDLIQELDLLEALLALEAGKEGQG